MAGRAIRGNKLVRVRGRGLELQLLWSRPLPLSGDGGSLPECYVLRNEAAVLGTTRNLEQHMVPLFIANGEIIRDDTAGKKYLGKETSGE